MSLKVYLLTMDITLKGGIERVLCNLANELTKDYDLEIISIFKSNEVVSYEINPNIKIYYVQNRKFEYKNYKSWLFLSFLKKEIPLKFNTQRIKVISFYPIITILLSFFYPKYRNKIIATEHSEYFSQGFLIRILRTIFYKYIHKIITLTNSGKLNFKKKGLNAEVIPNFVTNFNHDKQWNYYQNDNDNLNCLFAGRFEAVKQVDQIIYIAEKCINESSIQFTLLGDGPDFKYITNLAKEKKLDNLSFLGNVRDIQNFYANSDILILTSKTEAFPMVAIEAMSFGCIVICYDSQIGTCEIVTNTHDGFIIPFNDIELIAEKIHLLKKNTFLLNNMRKQSLKTAHRYQLESVINYWKKIIEE